MLANDPLTDSELDELDDFLSSDAVGEEGMDIAMLDGFLTALAIGPNTLPPSAWLTVVWGGEMNWKSEREADRITSLIFRHGNAIAACLRDEPEAYEPLVYEREHEGRIVPVIDEWCSGFVRAMALDEEGWRPLMETEEGDDMLFPILLYGTEAGWDELRDHPELEARHEDYAASLGDAVLAIHDWWLPVRKAKSTIRRDEPKVGRNDPCPCGSGKKFKRCCGASGRLH